MNEADKDKTDHTISFSAEPDVIACIDKIDEVDRDRMINALLRKGFEDRDDVLAYLLPRLTQKSLDVLHIAERETRRFGHRSIGTEQLLVGLLAQETGIAAGALISMGANLSTLRSEIKKIVGAGDGTVSDRIPYTPRAKRVLAASWEEAVRLKHNYVGTEHILLGLLSEGDGVATRVLEILDIDLEELRTHVLNKLQEFTQPKS